VITGEKYNRKIITGKNDKVITGEKYSIKIITGKNESRKL